MNRRRTTPIFATSAVDGNWKQERVMVQTRQDNYKTLYNVLRARIPASEQSDFALDKIVREFEINTFLTAVTELDYSSKIHSMIKSCKMGVVNICDSSIESMHSKDETNSASDKVETSGIFEEQDLDVLKFQALKKHLMGVSTTLPHKSQQLLPPEELAPVKKCKDRVQKVNWILSSNNEKPVHQNLVDNSEKRISETLGLPRYHQGTQDQQIAQHAFRQQQQQSKQRKQEKNIQDGGGALSTQQQESAKQMHDSGVDTVSSRALNDAVQGMHSVVKCVEAKGALGEDLASTTTNFRLQGLQLNADRKDGKRKSREHESSPLELNMGNGNVMNLFHAVADLDAPGHCLRKTASEQDKFQAYTFLQREIMETNAKLVETCMDIDKTATKEAAAQGNEGIIVSMFYNCSATVNQIRISSPHAYPWVPTDPIRILVPPDYPHSSPEIQSVLCPSDSNSPSMSFVHSDFIQLLRSLPPPLSLESIAKTWDECARNACIHLASLAGGGSFSSTVGLWKLCTDKVKGNDTKAHFHS